jgi:hypothetical protein
LRAQARQVDPATGFWSNLGAAFTVAVVPDVPAIVSLSTSAPPHSTSSVTVTGTGVAGQTISIYDGSGSIKTVVVVHS